MAAINQPTTAKGSRYPESESKESVTHQRTDGSPLIGLQPPKALGLPPNTQHPTPSNQPKPHPHPLAHQHNRRCNRRAKTQKRSCSHGHLARQVPCGLREIGGCQKWHLTLCKCRCHFGAAIFILSISFRFV